MNPTVFRVLSLLLKASSSAGLSNGSASLGATRSVGSPSLSLSSHFERMLKLQMTFSFFKSEISIFKGEDLHSVKALDNISVLDKK